MIALTLETEDAARYAEVRADVLGRLKRGDIEGERPRKPIAGGHNARRRTDGLSPGVVRFAEAVHDKCDPWSYLTVSDAAKAAGVARTTADQHIAKLKQANAWPYLAPGEPRRTIEIAKPRIGGR